MDYAGRRLLAGVSATELTGVGSDGYVALLDGTAPAVSPDGVSAAFQQSLPMVERRGLDRAAGEAFVQRLRPGFSILGPVQMAAWGQRRA